MNALYDILKGFDGRPVREILLDDQWIAEGYSFLVKNGAEWYCLVNTFDYEKIMDGVPGEFRSYLSKNWIGIPIQENREKVGLVSCGTWYVCSRIGKPAYY